MQLSDTQRALLDSEWDKVRGAIAECNVMMRYNEGDTWMPAIRRDASFYIPTGMKTAEPTQWRPCTPAEIEAELKAGGWVYIDWRPNRNKIATA